MRSIRGNHDNGVLSAARHLAFSRFPATETVHRIDVEVVPEVRRRVAGVCAGLGAIGVGSIALLGIGTAAV